MLGSDTDALHRADARKAGWAEAAATALDADGAVMISGAGLAETARSIGHRMLADLDRLLPFEEENTVYSAGQLRHNPPLDDRVPEVLGNGPLRELCRAVLDEYYVAGYEGHTILPGAQAQPVHADWEMLWPGLDVPLPPFMMAVNIALVDTDESNGSIEVWPGTHRLCGAGLFYPGSLEVREVHCERRRRDGRPVRANMAAGDMLVRDVRTWHRGMPNPGGTARPILWLLLPVSWYRIRYPADGEPEADDDFVLPPRLRPAIERLGVEVACRFADAPFDHLRLPAGS